MRLKLKDLQPNPFRDYDNYPLVEAKVTALEDTIKETGFWNNIPVRKNGTGYQIHFGHHRIQALKNVYGEEKMFNFPVDDVDDETMHKRMVAENAEEWGATTRQIDENVKTTKAFLVNNLEIAAKYVEEPKIWLKRAKTQASQNDTAVGGVIILAYLQSINTSWSKRKVDQSLARLKMIDTDGLNKEAIELIDSPNAAFTFAKICRDYELTDDQQMEAAEIIVEDGNYGEKEMLLVINDILYPPGPDEDDDIEEEEDLFDLDKFIQPIRGQTLRLRKELITIEKLLEEIGEDPFQNSVEYMLFSKEIGKLERKIKNFHLKELKA